MVVRWLLVLALAACTTDAVPLGPDVTSRVQKFVLPVRQPARLDLLFVIDNSPAMTPHRERLRANFANFINVLSTIQGGLPSLHVGVVTTDVGGCNNGEGDAGRMRTIDRVDGAFISDLRYESPERVRNYVGPLTDVFSELADVGSVGCIYARPLDAIRLALDHPANAGFLRDDSYLAVIVISATDDCSFTPAFTPVATTDPAVAAGHCYTYRDELLDIVAAAEALKARRSDRSRVTVSSISGPDGPIALRLGDRGFELGPSCSDEVGGATAAPRLRAFRDQFPNRSTFTTICQQNLSDGLVLFAGPWRPILGNPCVEAPLLDLAPEIEGVQAECTAAYQFLDGEQRTIPSCGWGEGIDLSDDATCWSIRSDWRNCPRDPGLAFFVTPSTEDFPIGVSVVADCLSE